jgi:biotin carboxyl carrier protein
MQYFVNIDDREHIVEVQELPGGRYDVRLVQPEEAGKTRVFATEVVARPGLLSVRLDGRVLDLVVDGQLPDLDVFASGRRAAVRVESARMRAALSVRARDTKGGDGVVSSPMPGKVVKVLVKEGDEVAVGTPLVVVEAMKMENELLAERAGVVSKVFVKTGDAVEGGARLIAVG